MKTYLDKIIAGHRARAALDSRSTRDLEHRALSGPPTRGFADALVGRGLSVIAEVKRRSPSKGDLLIDLDPAALAGDYVSGGATCLSVLTDGENFGGSPEDLRLAREATGVPVIRKDFTVHEHDVLDARVIGADCVLLIVAALSDGELEQFHGLAESVGLDVLVETHDEHELDRALAIGATLVGVNQRDLVTFEVDHERAKRVGAAIPRDVTSVCESGVRGPGDAASVARAGYDAVLVGESLVTSGDPRGAVAELVAAGQLGD